MKYIDNLIEWGDKLFRRDSMESIQEATQIYILAANILGPRPEKIPPIVSKEPLTFQKMRADSICSPTSRCAWRTSRCGGHFRINARPEIGRRRRGAADGYAVLLHAAQPAARQVLGHRRRPAVQDPQLPEHPGHRPAAAAVRAADRSRPAGARGRRRSRPRQRIASLNAPPPHYRFRFLLGRAVRLAEEIRSFGAMTLRVLERRDAEGLACAARVQRDRRCSTRCATSGRSRCGRSKRRWPSCRCSASTSRCRCSTSTPSSSS